ncbi:carbohydrate-binding protein [Dactylosporangium roseum]|uniref:carbohydrate-binding protein n=1 Tax=Dactylosporangium roseum TaxID=47989 RepID=UPI0036F1C48E
MGPEHRVHRCLQAHTSQVGWEPPNVAALWSAVRSGRAGRHAPTPRPSASGHLEESAVKVVARPYGRRRAPDLRIRAGPGQRRR